MPHGTPKQVQVAAAKSFEHSFALELPKIPGKLQKQIAFFNKQVKEINTEIKALSMQDEKVKESMKVICSITGVGLITAASALGETNGFDLIRNKRQITSYAGFDGKNSMAFFV